MPILHENEFFVLEIAGHHFLLTNQGMSCRQTKKEFFAEELVDRDPGVWRRLADKRKVELFFL